MAGAFPTLTDGQSVRYPFDYRVQCLTQVDRATNSAEQRYALRPAMVEFGLAFQNLSATDKAAIQSHHDSQKGAADSTWTFTLDVGLGTGMSTYTGMRYLDDSLRWEEGAPKMWNTKLRCRGFYPAWTVDGSLSFPSNLLACSPVIQRRDFDTNTVAALESGAQFALSFRAGGLTNFPSYPALAWDMSWSSVSAADAAQLIRWFVQCNGRLASFSFTDPAAAQTFSGCRFESDELLVQFVDYDHCVTSCSIFKA